MHNTSYKKSNFGPAFFFLPRAQKEALSDVYSFCRLVDDIVDEPRSNPQEELDFWRGEVKRAFGAQPPQTELGQKLQQHAQNFNLSEANFTSLIDGMEMDLQRAEYKTFEDLQIYLYRVASVVGLMCCEIFGAPKEASEEYATTLGYGVQMTNILRDIYADAELGRIYLPQTDVQKFNVRPDDIKNKNVKLLQPLIKFEAARAKDFFNKARELFPQQYKKQLFSARIMGALYEAILDKIEKNDYIFTEKIALTKTEKVFTIIKAIFK